MEETPIKVYIKIDSQNNIIEIDSDTFIKDFTNWIKIDEGFGDKYSHAQSQYLPLGVRNDSGGYNYQYVNKKVIEKVK